MVTKAKTDLGDQVACANLIVQGKCTAGAGQIAELNKRMDYLSRCPEIATKLLEALNFQYQEHAKEVGRKLDLLNTQFETYRSRVQAVKSEDITVFHIKSQTVRTVNEEATEPIARRRYCPMPHMVPEVLTAECSLSEFTTWKRAFKVWMGATYPDGATTEQRYLAF